MTEYNKTNQTYMKKKIRKECSKCGKTRLIKFYSTPRARICNTCKAKAKRLKKRSSKSYQTRKKDKAWANEVKKRANYKCEYCGSKKQLNAHHIFSRSNKAVRHDLDNGVCLCPKHHVFSTVFSAHKAPAEFIEWIKQKRGIEWYERLRDKAIKVKKA